MTTVWRPSLERLTALDQEFRYQQRAPDGVNWFDVLDADGPVLISAPHACGHLRDGVRKMQEEYTGALAQYVAEVCGCRAIVTRYQTDEDANWQADSVYKRAIESLHKNSGISLCIDLHGMTNRHRMGVALGTIKSTACDPELVLPHFLASGFVPTTQAALDHSDDVAWRRLVVDHSKFTGGVVNNTVTRFVSQELGVPAVQVELSSETRVVESAATSQWPHEYRGHPEAITAAAVALKSLVEAFS